MASNKFKVGEQCVYKTYGQKATIKSLDLTFDPNMTHYWIMFDESWFTDMLVREDELEEVTPLLPYGTVAKPKRAKCECGAHKTSNPGHHSHWCPEFGG